MEVDIEVGIELDTEMDIEGDIQGAWLGISRRYQKVHPEKTFNLLGELETCY